MTSKPLLSIVIPVYNERRYIEELLRRVQADSREKEIIVVDDASKDGTREWLQDVSRRQGAGEPDMEILNARARLPLGNFRFLFQEVNCGKGAALRRGFQEATGDIVLIQDAD